MKGKKKEELREAFEDIISHVFYESMETRFTEDEEIEKYIKENVEELIKLISD